MSKPWVGMPTRYDKESERFTQDRYYLDALCWAGSVPVLIPVGSERELIEEYADKLDAVLLPGSPTDIDPQGRSVRVCACASLSLSRT